MLKAQTCINTHTFFKKICDQIIEKKFIRKNIKKTVDKLDNFKISLGSSKQFDIFLNSVFLLR